MCHFEIRLPAQKDIQQIVDYYEEIAPAVTDTFIEELYAEFDLIKKNPLSFQKKHKTTRVRYLNRFSFGIHYNISGEKIEILAVLHTSRNPRAWKTR